MKGLFSNNKAQKSEWLSADGWDGADGWESAEGEYESADGWESADAWDSAAGPQKAMPTSSPYIIQIVNACTTAISNVDIGDSYTNRAASNFNANSNITITSTVTGVTYIEFLAQSESQPSKIGRTMIISTSAGQLDQTVAITHRDSAGNRQDHVVTPTLDPYQNQTDRIIDEYEYLFNGFTRLRFNQINASATVTVRMYPVQKFSATQLVAGRPAQVQYKAPHLVKVAPSAVPRPKALPGRR